VALNLRPADGLLVAALAALVLLPNLGGPPLWDEDEPRNAACSLAMRTSGDWIVPTFHGRLRVEKPALVNWLQLAGFATAGVNETGARIGSALLTLVTCLVTWRIAGLLFRTDVALWSGIAMATCLWTGVAGRAATPDAPLACFTTVALWLFVRGACTPGADGKRWRDGPVRLPLASAAGIGGACGLAMLTKGPVGLVPPLVGLGLFAWWQAATDPGRDGPLPRRLAAAATDAWRGLRPLVIVAVAVAVAAPWYVAVTLRTGGDWLREFILVHNVGRFAQPLEGHSGSSLFYYPLVILVGLFPWSVAAGLIGWRTFTGAARPSPAAPGMRLVVAWLAAWVVPFSLAGTKLPGYVWPAYPALALAAGGFLADWTSRPAAVTDRWMRLAWVSLGGCGAVLAVGLPFALNRLAPGTEWLGAIGLVPLVGAVLAWAAQSLGSRRGAAGAWALTAAATVALIVGPGATVVANTGGLRRLVTRLPATEPVVSYGTPPASLAFYAGRVAPGATVTAIDDARALGEFLALHPRAHLLVEARYQHEIDAVLPPGHRVLHAATAVPSARPLLLIGPGAARAPAALAAAPDAPTLR